MDEKSDKLKFLVLIDFSQNAYKALKYAISLAKSANGKIVLLYVASPRILTNSDSESSDLDTIEIDKNKTKVQLTSIIEMIEAEGIPAEYISAVGSVATKTKEHINLLKPTLIVLGKSNHQGKSLGEVTEYLLHQNNDNVLIIGNDNTFSKHTSISVECNKSSLINYSSNFLFWLNVNTTMPIRFYVNEPKQSEEEFILPENWNGIKNTKHKVCYKNSQYFSVSNGLKQHLLEENIELICIGRKQVKRTLFSKLFSQPSTTSEIIKNTQIPIMLMGKTV